MENKQQSGTVKKHSRHWLVWWQVDNDELKRQIDGYHTLKITQSARGQSALFLLFSAAVTFTFLIFGLYGLDNSAYVDIIMSFILAFLVYRGYRWALIVAMVYWTLEKVFTVIFIAQSGSTSGSSGILFGSLIWWALYMSAFWLALRVEIERRKNTNPAFLYCVKCGAKREKEAGFCAKCGTPFNALTQ